MAEGIRFHVECETRKNIADGMSPRDARRAAHLVSPGYFELMGIPMIRGTAFGDATLPSISPPVVLSARLARHLFGDQNPVGRRIIIPGYRRFIEQPAYTVAGVVGDVADQTLTADVAPTLYFPAILEPGVGADVTGSYPLTPRELTIVVEAGIVPLGLVSTIRNIVRELDPEIPVADVRILDDIVRAASARMRLVTTLLVLAAVTSLCLGLTGVYGVVAYSAS
jgi:hypothetical protein